MSGETWQARGSGVCAGAAVRAASCGKGARARGGADSAVGVRGASAGRGGEGRPRSAVL